MVTQERLNYLEKKLPKTVKMVKGGESIIMTVEEKYRANFEKYARYEGNGVYQWKGIRSTDTAELYLIGVLRSENIKFKEQ